MFSIFLNSNILDDFNPIKVVSYLRSFFFLSSITSEKSATKAFQKLTLGNFDAAIVLDNKIQRNILEINNKVIKKILTVPLTNISTLKKVAIFRIG